MFRRNKNIHGSRSWRLIAFFIYYPSSSQRSSSLVVPIPLLANRQCSQGQRAAAVDTGRTARLSRPNVVADVTEDHALRVDRVLVQRFVRCIDLVALQAILTRAIKCEWRLLFDNTISHCRTRMATQTTAACTPARWQNAAKLAASISTLRTPRSCARRRNANFSCSVMMRRLLVNEDAIIKKNAHLHCNRKMRRPGGPAPRKSHRMPLCYPRQPWRRGKKRGLSAASRSY